MGRQTFYSRVLHKGKSLTSTLKHQGQMGNCSQRGLLRALQRSETHHIHILLTTKGSLLDWLTCAEAVYFHNGCQQAGGRIGETSCHLSPGSLGTGETNDAALVRGQGLEGASGSHWVLTERPKKLEPHVPGHRNCKSLCLLGESSGASSFRLSSAFQFI